MEKLFQDDNVPRVSMQIVQDCLVLSVQVELFDATLDQLRTDLLDNITTSGVRRAIIDVSAVEVMDPHAYDSICDSANMAKVMGTNTIVSGIRPGVASALVDLGAEVGRVNTTMNLEYGFVELAQQAEEEPGDFNPPLENDSYGMSEADGPEPIAIDAGDGNGSLETVHETSVTQPEPLRPLPGKLPHE